MVLLEGGAEEFLQKLKALYQQCHEREAGTVYLTMKETAPREKKTKDTGGGSSAAAAAARAEPPEAQLLVRAKLSFSGKKISTWVSLRDAESFKEQVAAMQEQLCRKSEMKRQREQAAAEGAARTAAGPRQKRRRGAKRPDKRLQAVAEQAGGKGEAKGGKSS